MRKLLAERDPVAIGARARVIRRERAGEDAGCQHRRREARAFFIGPVDDLDRRVGLIVGLVKRAHRLERAEHAQRAVEFAAGRLSVEMAPHAQRG
jgi:hypothetical protein